MAQKRNNNVPTRFNNYPSYKKIKTNNSTINTYSNSYFNPRNFVLVADYSQSLGFCLNNITKNYRSDCDIFQTMLVNNINDNTTYILKSRIFPRYNKGYKDLITKYNIINNLNINYFMKFAGFYNCHSDLTNLIYKKGLKTILNHTKKNNLKSKLCASNKHYNANKLTIFYFKFIPNTITIKEYINTSSNYDTTYSNLIIIFRIVTDILFQAYNMNGFIHNDLNLRNILLNNTRHNYIDINKQTIPSIYTPFIIDFDDSYFNGSLSQFIDGINTFKNNIIIMLLSKYINNSNNRYSATQIKMNADFDNSIKDILQ